MYYINVVHFSTQYIFLTHANDALESEENVYKRFPKVQDVRTLNWLFVGLLLSSALRFFLYLLHCPQNGCTNHSKMDQKIKICLLLVVINYE